MKIRGAKQVHYDSGPNMTPLVDVVMVILIFLMLAGSFAGVEHYLESNVPFTDKGAGGAPPPPGFVPDEPLEIRVDSPVPDRFVARAGQITVDDADKLRMLLQKMRGQLENAGTKRDKVQVVIAPGRNVKYKFLVEVYQAALQADFQKVGFSPAH
jgi:biopolymer transport protein ExbD